MTSDRRRRARLLATTVATVVCIGAVASSASAAPPDLFGARYVSAQWAWATVSAHSGVYRVYTVSDHTMCPSLSQGHSGSFSAPGQNIIHGECSAGTEDWYPNFHPDYWHGTAYNPNEQTTDYMSDGAYYW